MKQALYCSVRDLNPLIKITRTAKQATGNPRNHYLRLVMAWLNRKHQGRVQWMGEKKAKVDDEN